MNKNTYRNRTTGEVASDGYTLIAWMENGEKFDLIDSDGKAVMGFVLQEVGL